MYLLLVAELGEQRLQPRPAYMGRGGAGRRCGAAGVSGLKGSQSNGGFSLAFTSPLQ